MKIQKKSNWYFGLYTSLRKFNINTKNHPEDYLICSIIPFESEKIKFLGKEIQVIILNKEIFEFGVVNNGIKYSDLEKTLIDFVYIWKMNGTKDHKIAKILQQYKDKVSNQKILNFYKRT